MRPDINLDPATVEGQLQGELLERASSLLLYFSTGSRDAKDALIREGVVSNLINFLCPLSPLYCYSPAAKSALKKLTLRKSLHGVFTKCNDKECASFTSLRDAYIRAEPNVRQKLRISPDCYDVDLFDISSGRRISISDILVSQGHVLRKIKSNELNSSLVEESIETGSDTEKQSETGNSCETGNGSETDENNSDTNNGYSNPCFLSKEEEIVVTAVCNGEYFWAKLGRKTMKQTTMVEQAILAQPEAERVYLTRPPVPGKNTICHYVKSSQQPVDSLK